MAHDILRPIILGIIQGITEFLPVSSTAHLILMPWFLGWSGTIDSLEFDVALHAGTLLAILIFFFRDWIEILIRRHRLLVMLIIATIPGAIIGAKFNEYVETTLRSPIIIAIDTVLFGIVMYICDRASKGRRDLKDMDLRDAVIVGISQAVALFPGVSRSGITISAALANGYDRVNSARLSFLLSTPIVLGAVVLKGHHILAHGLHGTDVSIFLSGFIASFIAGLLSIKFLIEFLKKYPLTLFVYYRFLLALVIVIGIWAKG